MLDFIKYSITGLILFSQLNTRAQQRLISYEVDPKLQEVRMYYKKEGGILYGNFTELKKDLTKQGKTLLFATNGGMYKKDQSPLGLYIENGKLIAAQNNVKKAFGNFYLQPNGIFYLTDKGEAVICQTDDFERSTEVIYATQSGPMLIINGELHPKFKEGSKNVFIRNGVGVLPNGNLLFAMSTERINFYDFAQYFLQKGCKNALYLDGFVSRTYLPEQNWTQTDGTFGVIIGATKVR